MKSPFNHSAGAPDISMELPEYGVWLESHQHQTGFQSSRHQHSHYSLIFVASGQGVCRIEEQEYPLLPNTVVMLSHHVAHEFIDSPGKPMTVFVGYFTIHRSPLSRTMLDELFEHVRPIHIPPYYSDRIRRYLRQILHEQSAKPVGYDIVIAQCFTLILLLIYRTRKAAQDRDAILTMGSEARVRHTLDFIQTNYFQPHTLPDAARMCRLSQRQFSNLCKKITGQTFIQHLNSIRVRHADQLLRNSSLPVAAIAFEVGFEELSTFYRAFKKIHNASPLQFREQK